MSNVLSLLGAIQSDVHEITRDLSHLVRGVDDLVRASKPEFDSSVPD